MRTVKPPVESCRFLVSLLSVFLLLLPCAAPVSGQGSDAVNLVSRPVGFLRISVPSNGLILASSPFLPLDPPVTSAEQALPILTWNGTDGYGESNLMVGTFVPGRGFWIDNRGLSSQAVYLAGEIALSPSNTMMIEPGLNLVGYPYAGAVRIEDTALGSLIGRVEILDEEARSPAATESVLGRGLWAKPLSTDAVVWTESRPYRDVFPTNGQSPRIRGVQVMAGGTGATLWVECEGHEVLDVFYQDVTATSRWESAGGWKLAETGLRADGRRVVTWDDVEVQDRRSTSEVLGRYYLVGRGDIDSDGDGEADARERFVAGDGQRGPDEEEASLRSRQSSVGPPAADSGHVVYVDSLTGSDGNDGLSAAAASGHGPKKTISGAVAAAGVGDRIQIAPGTYNETVFATAGKRLIFLTGKNVSVE